MQLAVQARMWCIVILELEIMDGMERV